jgi:hypothetical protein
MKGRPLFNSLFREKNFLFEITVFFLLEPFGQGNFFPGAGRKFPLPKLQTMQYTFSVLGYFAVILRQASFFALVEYEKSTLPQQKTRLPCLTAKFLQHLMLGYFAVILRQASFFALVEYEKSTLPQQKTRLPCLTAKFLQHLMLGYCAVILRQRHGPGRTTPLSGKDTRCYIKSVCSLPAPP